ncbi:MAG: putative PEP-binding protein [Candidatus Limnocylindria bacterium]
MTVLRGIPAAPGSATAVARLLTERPSTAADDGALTIAEAARTAAEQLEGLARRAETRGASEEAAILRAQAMMAGDPTLIADADFRAQSGPTRAQAVLEAADAAATLLEAGGDATFAPRAVDIRDVGARIARVLRSEKPPGLVERAVVVAADLPPSWMLELDRSLLVGVALERGSPTAHVAILARSLGVPEVVGIAGLVDAVGDGVDVSIDGSAGTILVGGAPAGEGVAAASQRTTGGVALAGSVRLRTADGHAVILGANVARSADARTAVDAGAESVGLLRTELIFAPSATLPDEATQSEIYEALFKVLADRRVAVRLADLGDQAAPLGVRGIRVVRCDRESLATQLRAVLRAAGATDVRLRLMAPMVADVPDLLILRDLVDAAVAALDADGRKRPASLDIGLMLELPAAAILADQLTAIADFVSIGTNDLTQFVMAADRSEPELADRQDPLHPAVVRAVATVADAAAMRRRPVSVCGEMAGDPLAAVVLVGLGVEELSMSPPAFEAVARALRRVTLHDAVLLAAACRDEESAADARALAADVVGLAT